MKLEIRHLAYLAAAIAGLLFVFHAASAFAVEPLTPQQKRMRVCNTQADQKELRGGERNHFIRTCLKGANGNGHRMTPRQKQNQACNDSAKKQGLQGAERRGVMSECTKPALAQQRPDKEKEKGCSLRADQRGLSGEERESYLKGCRTASGSQG